MTSNRTKKYLIALGATAGIAIGGLTATSVASAQTDDTVVEELPLQVDPPTDDTTPDGPGEDDDRPGRRGCGGRGMAGVAEAIGIEPESLREALDAGQSVADVATANGVDAASVVDALVDHAEERLAEKVADGDLTRAEADERLAEKTERANDRVFATPGDQAGGQPGNA